MPSGLAAVVKRVDLLSNGENKELIHRFVSFMKNTDVSQRYQKDNLFVILLYARHLGSKNLSAINRKQDVINFLETKRKDINTDPDQRWIRTWNDYLQRIKFFMRWLHNDPALPMSDWQTPEFAQIKKKKSNRLSPYTESELWERDELLTIVKYDSHKRNKAALTLLWDLNARNHEVTLLKVKHVRLGSRYGEAEIPYQAKTGSGPALLMCSFPYVRDWLNEHPFRNEPNANIICNLTTGRPITADTLATVMNQLKRRIQGLIQSGSISDTREKANLERLLRTKKWNPYCIRHSAISADSDYLPEFALRKKARWVMNSRQPSRYIKSRMGSELKQKILVQNGIISENEVRPKPAVSECWRCQTVCAIDSKFCISCSYPLTPSGFEEIKEREDSRFRSLEARFNELQSRVEEVIAGLGRMTDQQQINVMAKSLFSTGMLKVNDNK